MKLQISIDAKTYEVEVEIAEEDYSPQSQDNHPAPATATIQSTVLRTPPKPGSSLNPDLNEANLCRSPLAGIVVRVPVVAGQQLQVDDLMVMLEAMKMEITLTAPRDATVEVIRYIVGDMVEEGTELIHFAETAEA